MENLKNDKMFEVLPCKAVVTERTVEVMKCVEYFETGAENIYLVDQNGTYKWRAAKKSVSKIVSNGGNTWGLTMQTLPPLVVNGTLQGENLLRVKSVGSEFFHQISSTKELPIVDWGGQLYLY